MNIENTEDVIQTRILYVEDDSSLGKLFKSVIEEKGYEVDVAESGRDGLDRHRAAPYDIVAIDYQLPDMTGLEVAREMLSKTPMLPIVFVTGKGSEMVAAEAMALGVINYVIKGDKAVYTDLLPGIIDNLNRIRNERMEKAALIKAILESEARMQRSHRFANIGTWDWNTQTGALYWSERIGPLFGYESGELETSYENFVAAIHPDDREKVTDAVTACVEDGAEYNIEHRVVWPDGTIHWLHEQGDVVHDDDDGGTLHMLGVVRDISERKQVARELTGKVRELDFQKTALDEHAIVSMTDIKGNITYANDKFCTISGFSRDELQGQSHRILKSGEHSREFYTDLWKTISNGNVWHGNIKNHKKDGSFYWVDATIVPFLNEQGKPFQYVAIRTDITERKETERQLKESREHFLHAAKAANLCHWRSDAAMDLWLETSETTDQVIGTSAQELLGSYEKYLNMIHPDDLDRVNESYADISRKQQSYNLEYRIIGDDGMIRYLWEIGEPEYDEEGTLICYRGTTQNITDRKVAEHEAILAKEEADKANQSKSEFLSSMSHELRTPMNAILGFAQILKSNPKEPLSKTQKTSVNHIMKGGQHLLELINEVLDLAKIEAGKMELSYEDVSVRTVLDECLSLIQMMVDERGIEITVGEGFKPAIEIHADKIRFKQSLLNLMSNAVKYNRENGKITLDCHETAGGMLHIIVTDTGQGIPEDMLEELFAPFSRLGAENTETQGTGIGLSITKQLIERMDGHIGVDSELGKGTTFWIELPLRVRTLVGEEDVGMQEGGAKLRTVIDGTVLYMEDNPASLHLMEMIIDRIEGLSMISAHNAELGIELAKNESPDMIILDINLPGMDGFAALNTLQTLEKTKHIPVIALSANAMPKDIEKGIEAGFKLYLTKPIIVGEVADAIKKIIEGQPHNQDL